MCHFLRQEYGREPAEDELEAAMAGAEAAGEVMDQLEEMTPEELRATLKSSRTIN
jgi:hypothetical protein